MHPANSLSCYGSFLGPQSAISDDDDLSAQCPVTHKETPYYHERKEREFIVLLYMKKSIAHIKIQHTYVSGSGLFSGGIKKLDSVV